ncbi:MAG: beta-galactosidase [Opitutaceae bacterium]|jgi:hypothetical protein|nr:beta-galactosidase [Opitutaceae bacterium]
MRCSFAFSPSAIALGILLAASTSADIYAQERDYSGTAHDQGIHSSLIVDKKTIIKEWETSAKKYRELSAWAPGKITYELKDAGTPNAYAEMWTEKRTVVGSFKLSHPIPIADSMVEFEYRIPDHIVARELHLNLAIEGEKKKLTMRLPAFTGTWQRESIPLAGIVGGERWRQNPARRLATGIEIAFVANQEPACIQFRALAISRHPSPWGPLPVPSAIPVTGAGTQRTFRIEGAPKQAWAQIIASSTTDVILNGRNMGQIAVKNYDTNKWPSIPLAVAREFSLDGLLLPSAPNTLVLKSVDGTNADALCALGWVSGNNRHVIVSDKFWSKVESPATPLETTPRLSAPPNRWADIPDIYPLGIPNAWAVSPVASTLRTAPPAKAYTSLKNSAAGPWKTDASAEGRWKLVTPEGKSLYFLGVQALSLSPNINYRFYRSMVETYASEADFINGTLAQICDLGFNGIATASTSEGFYSAGVDAGLYAFQYISPEADGPFIRKYDGTILRRMGDPFDEGWKKRYRARAKAFADIWRNSPNMIGVFVNNEIPVEGSVNGNGISGYVYSDACRAVFIAWLANRYEDKIDNLKTAWRDALPAIDTIEDFPAVPTLNLSAKPQTDLKPEEGHATPRQFQSARDRLQSDLYAFAVHTMTVYADFILEVLREELPGKLIASNRFMGNATGEMIAAWKNYDLIAWNAYPLNQWQKGTYNEEQLEYMRQAHRITGKPLILGETGAQALDARLPNPAAQLYTQKQRGEEYSKLLWQVHNELPFVAGFVLFAWQNLSDSERQSWGILDDYGHPYADYADGIRKAHAEFWKKWR